MWFVADGLALVGPRIRQIDGRLLLVGQGLGEPRLGLGQIGLSRQPGIELGAGLVEGRLQHLDASDGRKLAKLVGVDLTTIGVARESRGGFPPPEKRLGP